MLPGPEVQQSASALGSACRGLMVGHRRAQAEPQSTRLHATAAVLVAAGKPGRSIVAARCVSGVVEVEVAAVVDVADSPTAAPDRSLWRTAGSGHVDMSRGTR
jgi:hypothetical protein